MARNIIKEWEGITNNGEEFPFSVENALDLLEDADDFYVWALQESQNILNFAEEQETTLEERAAELKK